MGLIFIQIPAAVHSPLLYNISGRIFTTCQSETLCQKWLFLPWSLQQQNNFRGVKVQSSKIHSTDRYTACYRRWDSSKSYSTCPMPHDSKQHRARIWVNEASCQWTGSATYSHDRVRFSLCHPSKDNLDSFQLWVKRHLPDTQRKQV